MIKVFDKVHEFIKWRDTVSESVGLVPTMGNLHQGHLSLVEKSLKENQYTVVTIFVNAKQFSPGEGFDKYPRTLENDIEMLSKLLSLDRDIYILAPQDDSEIYPKGFDSQITVQHLMTKVLCGAFRDGHFDGVTTVVYRLLELSKPKTAYFGEKDFQQLIIIKQMVKEQNLKVIISSLPIVRDRSGLALSSRNQYLSFKDKEDALKLPNSLLALSEELDKTNFQKVIAMRDQMIKSDSRWQYLEILDSNDLSTPSGNTKQFIIAGAYILGKTRIIDNKMKKNSSYL